ncbi:50S ribosomal protein L23 [Beggiatoa sp. PS]|nr:50S ribosomal protein L23 [Beggiatoa sp. PS]
MMNRARLLQAIRAPHISEKALKAADNHRQFVFKVDIKASKPLIKAAVEYLFNVKVKSVNVLNVKGKRKQFGRRPFKRSDWKKAYVGLQAGYDINFRGGDQ